MTNPETGRAIPNLFEQEDQRPVDEKSFENIRRFLSEGAIAPVREYPEGTKPDYQDKRIYYPQIHAHNLTIESWERNLRMTYESVFGDKRKVELAREHGIAHQNVNPIVLRTVRSLLRDSTREARARFSMESFEFNKRS